MASIQLIQGFDFNEFNRELEVVTNWQLSAKEFLFDYPKMGQRKCYKFKSCPEKIIRKPKLQCCPMML